LQKSGSIQIRIILRMKKILFVFRMILDVNTKNNLAKSPRLFGH